MDRIYERVRRKQNKHLPPSCRTTTRRFTTCAVTERVKPRKSFAVFVGSRQQKSGRKKTKDEKIATLAETQKRRFISPTDTSRTNVGRRTSRVLYANANTLHTHITRWKYTKSGVKYN